MRQRSRHWVAIVLVECMYYFGLALVIGLDAVMTRREIRKRRRQEARV